MLQLPPPWLPPFRPGTFRGQVVQKTGARLRLPASCPVNTLLTTHSVWDVPGALKSVIHLGSHLAQGAEHDLWKNPDRCTDPLCGLGEVFTLQALCLSQSREIKPTSQSRQRTRTESTSDVSVASPDLRCAPRSREGPHCPSLTIKPAAASPRVESAGGGLGTELTEPVSAHPAS